MRRITSILVLTGLLTSVLAASEEDSVTTEAKTDSIKTIIPDTKVFDFEGEGTPLEMGWIVVTDTIMDGKSTGNVSIAPDGAADSKQSLKVTGTVQSDNPFVMFAGVASRFGGSEELAYDVSGYTGVKFWAKGDGNTYRIDLPAAAVTDYMFHYYPFTPPAGEWKEYKIPFKGLKQQPYGKIVRWTGTDVVGMQFFTVGGPLESFSLQVDEIEFYKK